MSVGVGQVTPGLYSCTCMETDYAEYRVTVKKVDDELIVVDPGLGRVGLDVYTNSLTDLVMFKIG